MNRDDFPMLKNNLIYFDNGATTFKPKCVIDKITDYYENYSANAHRGDYDISFKVDEAYEKTRDLVKDFINAEKREEIIFTSGTTDSLNLVINGFFKYYLKKDDEVLLSKSEHASNILPWFNLSKEIGFNIKYIELDENLKINLDNFKRALTSKTKVISLAHVTNVVGDIRPIKEISEIAHNHGILLVVDGAQSVPHLKVDVKDLDIDFLTFSAHKMLGPTGVGILYGKYELLDQLTPTKLGGGMNALFNHDGFVQYQKLPSRLEGGTPNIAGVIGMGEAIRYLTSIGLDKIHEYEKELKEYAIKELKTVPNIIIYNENTESGIIALNMKDVFAQDLAIYLNKYHICVRAGNHCAKMLKEEIGIKNTCRISLYLYNAKEEIDYLVKVLKNPNIMKEII